MSIAKEVTRLLDIYHATYAPSYKDEFFSYQTSKDRDGFNNPLTIIKIYCLGVCVCTQSYKYLKHSV